MRRRVRFLLRQLDYDFASGLLARPALWIGALSLLAVLLPPLELRWAPGLSRLLATEPSSAQVVLGTLAGSMMSVVGVVYSILLVALSLASMQFSTRILAGMTRDRVAQNTLGLFIGAFAYCLLVMRAVHTDPTPAVPGVAFTGAVALAMGALCALVYFIHHLIHAIQANHLVAGIARETAAVIDEVFTEVLQEGELPQDAVVPAVPADAARLRSPASGYIQLIDVEGLRAIASRGHRVQLLRPMGAFVAEGQPLLAVWPAPSAVDAANGLGAIDLGNVRTMQLDVEFGLRQIVDIALKAVSPAVNDPSTAATCVDHLGALLLRVARRRPLRAEHASVVVPCATHGGLVDLAFEQIRQYTKTDMAVSLRVLRVLAELAGETRHEGMRARIRAQAKLIEGAARAHFAAEECDELTRRLAALAAHDPTANSAAPS